ncbi:MAG: carboxypeptidase-like regulatory domain-containing protein [Planctomycetota bacterium]|jgi:hypothetical protein
MARTDTSRRAAGRLATLLGAGLILAGCSGTDCVAGAVCDGDVTGTISGTVTAGTDGIANVVATLSDGTTATTANSGAYSMSDVPLGTYTVTISSIPPSVTCSTTSQSVALSDSERQATADFACERLDIGTPDGR